MEELKFFRKSECIKFPSRGTEQSAGIDFYIPKPESLKDPYLQELINNVRKMYEEKFENPKEWIEAFNNRIFKAEDAIDAFWITIINYNRLMFDNVLPIRYDFDGDFILESDQHIVIPTGITANIPHGYLINIENKSGIATKRCYDVGACIIDEDYTGIIYIDLHNIGSRANIIKCGEKIAQGIIQKSYIDEVKIKCLDGENDKGKTERGSGGFGSTGNQ